MENKGHCGPSLAQTEVTGKIRSALHLDLHQEGPNTTFPYDQPISTGLRQLL